jgi:large subunit ribosomal protein L10
MAKFVRELIIRELTGKLEGLNAVFVVNYRGLNSSQALEVRKKLFDMGAEIEVVKNSLARIALNKVGIQGLDDSLKDQAALVYGGEEATVLAKFLFAWSKKNKEMLEIQAGSADGVVMNATECLAFSKLPTKSELLSSIAGAVVGNLTTIAGCMNNLVGGVAAAVDAVREKKEEAA